MRRQETVTLTSPSEGNETDNLQSAMVWGNEKHHCRLGVFLNRRQWKSADRENGAAESTGHLRTHSNVLLTQIPGEISNLAEVTTNAFGECWRNVGRRWLMMPVVANHDATPLDRIQLGQPSDITAGFVSRSRQERNRSEPRRHG